MKTKIALSHLSLLIILSVGFISPNEINEIANHDSNKYKAYYVAALIDRFRPDTVWHDVIPCTMPYDIDDKAGKEIDSLVNLSFSRLWAYNDERREGKGSREYFMLDELCVAYELLEVINSNDLDLLARAFAERVKNQQAVRKQ